MRHILSLFLIIQTTILTAQKPSELTVSIIGCSREATEGQIQLCINDRIIAEKPLTSDSAYFNLNEVSFNAHESEKSIGVFVFPNPVLSNKLEIRCYNPSQSEGTLTFYTLSGTEMGKIYSSTNKPIRLDNAKGIIVYQYKHVNVFEAGKIISFSQQISVKASFVEHPVNKNLKNSSDLLSEERYSLFFINSQNHKHIIDSNLSITPEEHLKVKYNIYTKDLEFSSLF